MPTWKLYWDRSWLGLIRLSTSGELWINPTLRCDYLCWRSWSSTESPVVSTHHTRLGNVLPSSRHNQTGWGVTRSTRERAGQTETASPTIKPIVYCHQYQYQSLKHKLMSSILMFSIIASPKFILCSKVSGIFRPGNRTVGLSVWVRWDHKVNSINIVLRGISFTWPNYSDPIISYHKQVSLIVILENREHRQRFLLSAICEMQLSGFCLVIISPEEHFVQNSLVESKSGWWLGGNKGGCSSPRQSVMVLVRRLCEARMCYCSDSFNNGNMEMAVKGWRCY